MIPCFDFPKNEVPPLSKTSQVQATSPKTDVKICGRGTVLSICTVKGEIGCPFSSVFGSYPTGHFSRWCVDQTVTFQYSYNIKVLFTSLITLIPLTISGKDFSPLSAVGETLIRRTKVCPMEIRVTRELCVVVRHCVPRQNVGSNILT
jgi:hypothetical protein